jgi:hypothetical protein
MRQFLMWRGARDMVEVLLDLLGELLMVGAAILLQDAFNIDAWSMMFSC